MEAIIIFLIGVALLGGYNGYMDKQDGVQEVHNEIRLKSERSEVR